MLIPNFAELISESLLFWHHAVSKNSQVKLLWDCNATQIIMFSITIHMYADVLDLICIVIMVVNKYLFQITDIIIPADNNMATVYSKNTPQRCSL